MKRLAAFAATLLGISSLWAVPSALAGPGPKVLYVGATAGSNQSCASPGFTSVQAAVDAASDKATVYLCGTTPFAGEVFVDKSITLTGDSGASLVAPSSYAAPSTLLSRLPAQFSSDNLFVPQAIVVISGVSTNASLIGLGIAGPLPGTGGCANQEFGVLVIGGASANLNGDSVTNIQDANASLNGCQFGVGIQVGREYWPTADFSTFDTENFVGQATINNTTVSGYAKNGVTVDGQGSSAKLSNNAVTGFGPTTVVAQNGIQISRGATGQVNNNSVSANQYTGTGGASSTGVLIYGGCGDPLVTGVDVHNNTLTNNDVGVYLGNYDSTCSLPATQKTNDSAHNNTITNDAITNASGNGPGVGYQAGILDTGYGDDIHNNTISGVGYTPAQSSSTVVITPIDTSSTTNAKVHNNTID